MKNPYGLQYIMDGSGNYYKINEKNRLVVALGEEDATQFTFFDANQRIGGQSATCTYFAVPVETVVPKEKEETIVDMNRTGSIRKEDLIQNLEGIYYLASVSGKRIKELNEEISVADQKICDVLHLYELYELTEEEALRGTEIIKEERQRRRDLKDEITCLEWYQESFGTKENLDEAKSLMNQIKKLNYRAYKPRQLLHLFEGMEGRKINRDSYITPGHIKKDNTECTDCEEEGVLVMDYIKKETVYDERENDWIGFAKEQLAFYQNIPQYMVNLQIAIDTIDQVIEDTLSNIEDANYNVAQGYKAFKELKDLRTERKEKQQELDCLSMLTQGINFTAMSELFMENISQVEERDEEDAYTPLLQVC